MSRSEFYPTKVLQNDTRRINVCEVTDQKYRAKCTTLRPRRSSTNRSRKRSQNSAVSRHQPRCEHNNNT